MLKLTALTFKNPETGTEVTVSLPKELELQKPFDDDVASANFLAGAIMIGADDAAKKLNFSKE